MRFPSLICAVAAANAAWACGAHTIVPAASTDAAAGSSAQAGTSSFDASTEAAAGAGFWSQVPLSTSPSLYGVWGSGSSDVWAVGLDGTVLHWDGTSWSAGSSASSASFFCVWGANANDIWAAGDAGTLVH